MEAATTAIAEIRLRDLTKQFREVLAVDHVNLEIQTGEFFSLLGPSGCGKTTTLRMMGGLEAPTSGTIEIRGNDVTAHPPERRPVNTVFQNYALFPHLNVFENVAFGLRRRHESKDEIRRRVGDALALVRLTGLDKRSPDRLSGGQQQRVALARALVCEPTVLLLDEPLGALDLKLRKQLQVELKRIQREVGITFVYVTHDQEEALTLSDRIAVMRAGQVEQLGSPEELYDRPRNRFVAGFIGTTNILDGHVVSVGIDGSVIRLSTGELCVGPAGAPAAGQPVELAIRPEAIELCAATEGTGVAATPAGPLDGGASSLRGHIEQSAYLGTGISYIVRTVGGQLVTVSCARSADRFETGGLVQLAWQPASALVLAPTEESGRAAPLAETNAQEKSA
jgi:spermidine/putrescine transport system ATP-binding protein